MGRLQFSESQLLGRTGHTLAEQCKAAEGEAESQVLRARLLADRPRKIVQRRQRHINLLKPEDLRTLESAGCRMVSQSAY